MALDSRKVKKRLKPGEEPPTWEEYIESAYRTALGVLALRPWEFWISTPAEIAAMSDGYVERGKESLRQREMLACWIINGTGMSKTAVRPGDLLKFREEPDLSEEEAKKFVRESAEFAKTKFWGKVSDEYAPKKTE